MVPNDINLTRRAEERIWGGTSFEKQGQMLENTKGANFRVGD